MKTIPPFFILSNPRSGSSLLRIMLDCHPNIVVPPECGFMEWWYSKYKNWSIKDSENVSKVEEFCIDLSTSRKFETWHFNITLFKDHISQVKPKNYSELCAHVYVFFGFDKGKSIQLWGDKNNYYIDKLPLLDDLYPKAKYIHLIRDGRDVAVSYLEINSLETKSKYKPKLPLEIDAIADDWVSNNFKVEKFFNHIDSERKQIIRYEDLLINTEDTVKQICDFLNIDFSSNMLNYYLHNKTEIIEPLELLDWKKKTLEKPDITNIGRFKYLLSNQQLEIFESQAKSSLMHYGYN